MKKENLIGKKWGQLSSEEQKELLSIANPIDARDMSAVYSGDCTIDFLETPLSVIGKVISNEYEYSIKIDDNAIFYNSSEGIIEDDLIR